jgi:ABC-2 type transport system ATP-binding protein
VGIIREGRVVRVGGVAEVKDIKRYEIAITFGDPVPTEAFAKLDGVARIDEAADGRSLRIAMQGPPDAVIKAAARYRVLSLSSHEPSLEDIFLRYYEGDDLRAKETADVA